ncbi:Proteinase inhibitor, partial [Parasponia andersonii]
KQSWPEMVGVRGEVAEATIERENPGVDAVIVLEGTPGDTQFGLIGFVLWSMKMALLISFLELVRSL